MLSRLAVDCQVVADDVKAAGSMGTGVAALVEAGIRVGLGQQSSELMP